MQRMAHQTFVRHDLIVFESDNRLENRADAARSHGRDQGGVREGSEARDKHGAATICLLHDKHASIDA